MTSGMPWDECKEGPIEKEESRVEYLPAVIVDEELE